MIMAPGIPRKRKQQNSKTARSDPCQRMVLLQPTVWRDEVWEPSEITDTNDIIYLSRDTVIIGSICESKLIQTKFGLKNKNVKMKWLYKYNSSFL